MQVKHKQASILAIIFSIYCLFANYIIFIFHWQESHIAKAGQHRPDETVIVKWLYPALGDIAMIGAVILLISAYLHRRESIQAWNVSMLGILLMVLGTVFPVVGSASAGIFPKYVLVAIPNLVAFYLFILYVRKVDGRIVALATLIGLTFSVSLFNGIASASRAFQHGGVGGEHIFAGEPGYPDVGSPAKFVASQRLNWFASALWITYMMSMFLKKPKEVLLMIATAAVVFNLFGGILLAMDTILAERIFSMFALAPIFAVILFFFTASKKSDRVFDEWRNSPN